MSLLTIDASTLSRFLRCRREYYNYARLKRESADPRPGLMFGRVIHTGLEVWRKTGSADAAATATSTAYAKESIPLDNYRTEQLALDVVEKYIETYPQEPFKTITSPSGELAIEKGFALPICHIADTDVIWTGRIDEIIEYPDGSIAIKDIKTASRGGETYWQAFELSLAQLGYCWAVNQLFGFPPTSYLIDCIFVGEPRKDFSCRIEPMRRRFPVGFSQLDRWSRMVIYWLGQLIQDTTFMYNYAACTDRKYGSCEYMKVCTVSDVSQPTMLASNLFNDVTWNPLDERKTICP